jgi:hypothetical protein
MAILEPAAIRCGLKPAELWEMSIADIETVIKTVTEKERKKTDQDHKFQDLLNGKFCSVYASFHGVESCPSDYMVTAPETEHPLTPEEVGDHAFRDLSRASTGGN